MYKNIFPTLVKNFLIPALIIIPIILFMGLYNYRVTGHATELPYNQHNKQYAIWSPFIWHQTPGKEPTYRLDFIKRTWVDWDTHTKLFSRQHPITTFINNFKNTVQFYVGNVFYVFLFFLILALIFGGKNIILSIFFDKKNRPIMGLLLFYILTTSIILEILPHYTAPAAALTYLALIMAVRTFSFFSYKNIPLGILCCLTLLVFFLMVTTQTIKSENNRFLYPKKHFLEKRKLVLSILNQQPGLQLVFVTQGRRNDPNEIWVFNQANIDGSKIVWANDISPEKNQRLIDYYHHTRTIWKLNDDAELTLALYNNSKKEPVLIIKNPTPPI